MFRATRDGFEGSKFHSLCDNKGSTLVFIKSEHGNKFGGYSNSSWTSENKYTNDNKCFIFSITHQEKLGFINESKY